MALCKPLRRSLPLCVLLTATCAVAQVAPSAPGATLFSNSSLPSVSSWLTPQNPESTDTGQQQDAVPLLRDFKESDIKFSLGAMMEILRDHRHEGWVLAAYPDPNTRRPLIGAGFSLDVPARIHTQTDPLNPHPFVEPSSAQLWQAAGLAPERLQQILEEYDRHLNEWAPRTYRHKVIRQTLTPQLSEEEGEQLLRISAIQAIVNARAYCRNFDQLSAGQQMALSQLVFQMGVNLEQFVSFLGALNDQNGDRELPQLDGYIETGPDHWKTVQDTLMDSHWARLYSVRAASVIAMFDPAYSQQPAAAEQRVLAVLHPPVEAHRKKRATLRLAAYSKHPARGRGKKAAPTQVKRKLT